MIWKTAHSSKRSVLFSDGQAANRLNMMDQGSQALLSGGRRRLVSPGRLLWLVLFLITLLVVVTNLHEVKQIMSELRHAQSSFVALALAAEVLFVLNLTLFYATSFWMTGLRASVWRFVFISQAAYFVNLVSKTGGIGGIAFFLQEARRTGQPAARVGAAYMVAYVLTYAAFILTLIVALVLLYVEGSLQRQELIASGVMAFIMIAVGAVPIVALRSKQSLERTYLLVSRVLNRLARLLRRKPFVQMDSSRAAAGELYDAVDYVKRRPFGYLLPFLHAMGIEAFAAAMLYFMAHAVHADITVTQAISAYAVSLLFSLIAITPSGIGFVEVSLSVLLISFGVSRDSAIAAAIGYRAFEFWLPVLLGAASLPVLQYIQRTSEQR